MGTKRQNYHKHVLKLQHVSFCIIWRIRVLGINTTNSMLGMVVTYTVCMQNDVLCYGVLGMSAYSFCSCYFEVYKLFGDIQS